MFQVFYLVDKQVYKLELFKKCKIHDILAVLLIAQDTFRKKQVDKNVGQIDFNAGNNHNEKYKIEAIKESAVDAKN